MDGGAGRRGRADGGPDGGADDEERGRMARNKDQTVGNRSRMIENRGWTMENKGRTTRKGGGR